MTELTQSGGAGSCHMDGYVQGNEHRVEKTTQTKEPLIFLVLKIKVLGTGVCLVCYTTPMYNAS